MDPPAADPPDSADTVSEVTLLLAAVERGDPHAAGRLWPLVYAELRQLAGALMAGERPGQTLDATALVHEAYLRLNVDPDHPFANRRQNQFGVLVGGPVYLPRFGEGKPSWYKGRDRTFFFFAYEPRYYSDGSNIDALLPTEAMRRGDLSNAVNVSGGLAPAAIANQFVQSGLLNTNQLGVPVTIFQQFNLAAGSNSQLAPRLDNRTTGQASFAQFPNNVIPAFGNPGTTNNALRSTTKYTIYEYAIAAVNGNGESKPSVPVSTNPASWLNWDPKPGEPFRRRVSTRDAPYDESQPSYYSRK